MTKVYSKALDETIHVERVIGRVDGEKPGPCLFFFGGIHGNEPASVFALNKVLGALANKQSELRGSVIAISGNLWALERSVRFHKEDLNRLWTEEKLAALKSGEMLPKNEDEKQQLEIYRLLQDLMKNEAGPFYFFDLHTTSGPTIPFITVNDSLLNRKFTSQYTVPLILGIEEYINGPLLSYINELGYVSFGFEGGQHDDLRSIENHEIFIYLTLVFAGALNKSAIPFDEYMKRWDTIIPNRRAFHEIYERFEVRENDHFVMKPGFSNFQRIYKNETLATMNGETISSTEKSTLFMPLYQNQGSDGYFLIRRIPSFFLWLSRKLRNHNIDRVFVLLPGVKWENDLRDTMLVNLRIARFVSKKLFHLFGYRSTRIDHNYLLIKNREHRSKKHEYQEEPWY